MTLLKVAQRLVQLEHLPVDESQHVQVELCLLDLVGVLIQLDQSQTTLVVLD